MIVLADAYIAATIAADIDTIATLCEPDTVVWHNFDSLEIGIAASCRTLQWLHWRMPDVTWTESRLTATTDGFVWQATMRGTVAGVTVRVPTCAVVSLAPTGRICRIEEYLDPAPLTVTRPTSRVQRDHTDDPAYAT